MVSTREIEFAACFPFSNTAKKLLQQTSTSLNDFSQLARDTAKLRVLKALQKKPLKISSYLAGKDLMFSLLLSYPAARILVSLLGKQHFNGFAYNCALSTKEVLEKKEEKNNEGFDLCLQLLKDQKILYFPTLKNEELLIQLSAKDYLQNLGVFTPSLFSVEIQKGKIFLTKRQLTNFVAGITFKKTLQGLPVKTELTPEWVNKMAENILAFFKEHEQKSFSKVKGFTGKVDISCFPPCMKSLYSKLISGENLPHMARFYLASFLVSVNTPKEGIIKAFSFAPNYDEKITVYQIENILKKKYLPPSCQKIREQGYCPEIDCKNSHPLKTYIANLKQQKKPRN